MNGISHFLLESLGWRFLLALAISTALWARLTLDQNPARTDLYPTEIPVEAQNTASGLVLGGDLPTIKVRATAPQESWKRLEVSSFRAAVNLADLGPGLHQVDVYVDVADPQVRVLEKLPAKVSVRLEPLKEEKVPVRVDLTGALPFGYIALIDQLETNPQAVTVAGPESLVQRVTHALVAVRLDEARARIERTVRPEARGSSGVVAGVRIDPQTVSVSLPVQQQSSWKDVPVVANYTGQQATGYWVRGVSVDPTFVQIVGDPTVIGRVQLLETDPVDISGAQSDVVRTVTIRRPQGVSLARDQVATVRVVVQPVPTSQTRPVSVDVVGMVTTLVATAAPSQVQVTLTGPAPELAQLEAEDVTVTVDMTDLGPGTHAVQVKTTAPETVRVDRAQPDTVMITVSQRP